MRNFFAKIEEMPLYLFEFVVYFKLDNYIYYCILRRNTGMASQYKPKHNRPHRERDSRPETTEAPAQRDDLIAGRNAVSEALKSGRAIDHLLVARGEHSGSLTVLVAKAKDAGIPVKEVDSRKLTALCGPNHQGIAAAAACKEYAPLDDLFRLAEERGEPPLFVVCDELEDPHNLGAIIRTAEAAGAHGVIVPKRRSTGLTSIVYKTSAGAVEYLPVCRVGNLADTLRELKERGVWVYGLDMDGQSWTETDLTGATALVVGSEGRGIGRLVRECCEFVVSLPMHGHINSLNASVATGILLYEAARQRHR